PTRPPQPARSESHPAHPQGCGAAEGAARSPEEVPWWSCIHSTTSFRYWGSGGSGLWMKGHQRGKGMDRDQDSRHHGDGTGPSEPRRRNQTASVAAGRLALEPSQHATAKEGPHAATDFGL